MSGSYFALFMGCRSITMEYRDIIPYPTLIPAAAHPGYVYVMDRNSSSWRRSNDLPFVVTLLLSGSKQR